MPIPAIRAKQTTSTTGTGTITLNAAPGDMRSFTAAFGGSSVKVRYILSRAGIYEEGYGIFNGSTTLTRDTVIASSNAGALVSLAAGDTDVFFDFLPGDRYHHNVTGSVTLALADIGNFVRCTPSADMTLTLPPIASVPPGMGFLVKNDGTNNAIISIDPNGSELLEGSTIPFPFFIGESVELFSIGPSWRFAMRPTGWRFVGRTSAVAAASVDFVLPQWGGGAARAQHRVDFRQVRGSVDGAALWLRTDDSGGASFDAGASDYVTSSVVVSGATAVSGFETVAAQLGLSTDLDTSNGGNTITGSVAINPGAAGARYPTIYGQSVARGNGLTFAGWQTMTFGGCRANTSDINAIRFLMASGNINLGDFDQFACFD